MAFSFLCKMLEPSSGIHGVVAGIIRINPQEYAVAE
jgi:hypothetical protein